jgi:hypothetical protein
VTIDQGGGPTPLSCNPLPIVTFTSPDFNADGVVNLLDLAMFVSCYQPNYCPEADFDGNGVVGLSDVVIMQKYFGYIPKAAPEAAEAPGQSWAKSDVAQGLFNGCLQLDFDEDGNAATLRDSIFVAAGVPFDLSLVATDFRSLSGVRFDLVLPYAVMLYPMGCFLPEPPFGLALGQTVPCGSTTMPTTTLTINDAPCLDTGPVFVCHLQLVSTTDQVLKTSYFPLSGVFSSCSLHPFEMEACIGSPTPCEVSSIDIGAPRFVTCPGGDLASSDIVTVTLLDQDLNPLPGIPEGEITLSVFNEGTNDTEGRFRLTPLLDQTNAEGRISYLFEPREPCRWDGCMDLVITARIEACELVASKRIRTVNVVRFDDDPGPGVDIINANDEQLMSDALLTLDPCLDLVQEFRCPVVTQASMDLVQGHMDHSCSVTATPPVLDRKLAQLDQNVPNPFNPSTVLTVRLRQSAPQARLEVYALDGRCVRTLWNGPLPAGESAFRWDGTDAQSRSVASGIYVARLSAGQDHASVRMVLLR